MATDAKPDQAPALYLKLDDIGRDGKVADASGNNLEGTLEGNPTLVPDDKFGSCLYFAGQNDFVHFESSTVASFDLSKGLTVEAWACVQSEDATKISVVSYLEGANNLFIALYIKDSKLLFEIDGSSIEGALQINKWMHLAATIDRDGNAHLYRDGDRAETRFVEFQLPADLSVLSIGGYREDADYGFQGKLAHMRIYPRALSADEIRRDMRRDELALSSFTASHPLDFRILDRDEKTFLYVDDDASDHEMTVEVTNDGKHPVTLLPPPSPPEFSGKAEEVAQAMESFFIKNNHLELRFRRGLFSEKSVKLLRDFQAIQFDQAKIQAAAKNADSPHAALNKKLGGWRLFYTEDPGPGSASIYLLRKAARTLQAADADSDDDMLAVTLARMTASRRGGARNTPFELRPGPLTKIEDGHDTPLVGSRVHSISVLNHRGRQRIPLHVGFVGSNTILNDGTACELTLQITNVSHDTIALDSDDSPSQFIITFDEGKVADKEWALGDAGQVGGIEVWAHTTLADLNQRAEQDAQRRKEYRQDQIRGEGSPAEFVIKKANLPIGWKLAGGKSIYVRLANITTRHPTGPANLYLHYENIPGYWDDQFVLPIQKTPLLFREYADGNRVGIGTDDPKTNLHIHSGADAGSHHRGLLIIGDAGGSHLALDNDKLFVNSSETAAGILYLQDNGGATVIGGKVGIGTQATSSQLESNLTVRTSQTDGWGFEHTDGSIRLQTRIESSDKGSSFGNRTEHKLHLMTNNTSRVCIDATGNVGIGTDDPATKLHIRGTASAAVGTADSGLLIIGDAAGQHLAMDGDDIYAKRSGTAAGTLYLQYNGGGKTYIGGDLTVVGNCGSLKATTLSDGTTSKSVSELVGTGDEIVRRMDKSEEQTDRWVYQVNLNRWKDRPNGCRITIYAQHELATGDYGIRVYEGILVFEQPGYTKNNPDYPNKFIRGAVSWQAPWCSGKHGIRGGSFKMGNGPGSTKEYIMKDYQDWVRVYDYDHADDRKDPVEQLNIYVSFHKRVSGRVRVTDA